MNYRPSLDYLKTRISVDVENGIVFWIDATKHHKPLVGCQAGSKRGGSSNGKYYWHVKIDTAPIKRSHIIFLFATGKWPELQIDHINGDSLDDRFENLREVTPTQNAWNHKKRAKKSDCPMGVRRLKSGRYLARIACNKQMFQFGPFETQDEASAIYQRKRKEMFGDYA